MSFQAYAHHSRAEFAGDVIELEGELVEVRWANPHPTFKLRLSDGSDEVWDIQPSPGTVYLFARTLQQPQLRR